MDRKDAAVTAALLLGSGFSTFEAAAQVGLSVHQVRRTAREIYKITFTSTEIPFADAPRGWRCPICGYPSDTQPCPACCARQSHGPLPPEVPDPDDGELIRIRSDG
jgi:hypothetical protein